MTYKPADKDAMLRELKREDTTVDLDPTAPWSFGSGINLIGEGTLLDGHGATLVWPTNMGRLRVEDAPSVTLRNLNLIGWVNIHNVVSPKFTCEDVLIRNSVPGSPYLNIGAAGGATGAFNVQGDAGVTLTDLVFRRCTSENPYHHSFNLNLQDHAEGGGFKNVLYDHCISKGAGAVVLGRDPRTIWSCGLDIPDAGDIENMHVVDCQIIDPLQDGIHLDGSWDGHRQIVKNVVIERCTVIGAGARCPEVSAEKFRSGIYTHAGTIIDCTTEGCYGAGIGIANTEPDSIEIRGCVDTGSAYGLILNYAAFGARVQFVSKAAKVRAFVGQGGSGGGTLDLTVQDFAGSGPAVTFGRALRIDYIDCPEHNGSDAGDQGPKYDQIGYTLDGSKIVVRYVGDKPTVETWKRSHVTGTPTFIELTDEPTAPPVVVPPDPRDDGRFKIVDGAIWWADKPGGTFAQQKTAFLDEEALGKFWWNVEYGPVKKED